MTDNSIRNISFSTSVFVHIIIILSFLYVKFSLDYPPQKYVELSFGTSGLPGSSGAMGTQIDNVEQVAQKQQNNTSKDQSVDVKKIDLPKAANTSEDNVVKPAEKEKVKAQIDNTKSNEAVNSNINSEGKGNKTSGTGSFGYDIDWGGQGQRKIYSYFVPAYPAGVDKEIDIRLKFTIMPDGTVGTIIPLIKADTRLESAAINSLRQWRFEPLSPNQKQIEQTAVIVFPYRLQ